MNKDQILAKLNEYLVKLNAQAADIFEREGHTDLLARIESDIGDIRREIKEVKMLMI